MRKSADTEAIDYWARMEQSPERLRAKIRAWLKLNMWKMVINSTLLLKRVLDILVATAATLVFSPIFAITSLFIKLEDGGPLFFRQTRVGKYGRLFQMWKFRSMVLNADKLKEELAQQNESKAGVIFKMKKDPRITKVGRWIRKLSIDELPQLWNVLKGDMSLVGPRPAIPSEVAEYGVQDRLRLIAKPGITCFWQVSGRSNIDFEGQVRLDLQYVQSENVWTDIVILFRTVPAVLWGTGAY